MKRHNNVKYAPYNTDKFIDSNKAAVLVTLTIMACVFGVVVGANGIWPAFLTLTLVIPWLRYFYMMHMHEAVVISGYEKKLLYNNYHQLTAESQAQIPLTVGYIKAMNNEDVRKVKAAIAHLDLAERRNARAQEQLDSRGADLVKMIEQRDAEVLNHTEEILKVVQGVRDGVM